jgi:hypothetical protein
MTERIVIELGDEGWTASSLWRRDHPQRDNCPACGKTCLRTALINLAYVFTPCDCELVDYGHLYEQLWHLPCLRGSEPSDG